MYDKVGKIAKTLLRGFGDAIIGIDATNDGKWVLATTKTYLLLVLASCKEKSTGFETKMGSEKPIPVCLRIKPRDIKRHGLSPLNFTPAKFNVSKTKHETSIVTASGNHLIHWNFNKIRKGVYDDYTITSTKEKVKQNQFKLEMDQVVVTLDKNLGIHN